MSQLLAGYARACITPKESVPLGGYGNDLARTSVRVLSDLYTICLAFTDGEGSTVLLFENDLLLTSEQVFNPIRQAVAEAAGLTPDRVLVGATHTHSGPAVTTDAPSIRRYLPFLREQMVSCAKAALADRRPASLAAAEGRTKELSYVRHYVLRDGTYKGVNLNVLSKVPVAWHSSEPDPVIRLVKFTRPGGKDIVAVNWQCHPTRTGFGKFDLSADIVGVLRDEMEAALDCRCVYYSGASGNINALSFDLAENHYGDYLAHGRALAQCALAAAERFVPLKAGRVQLLSQVVGEPFNDLRDETLLETARDVKAYWERTNNYRDTIAYAESRGMHSQYQAISILGRHAMAQAGTREVDLPVAAFSVGDAAFVTAPYEMFDTNGKYVRDFSPFPATMVVTCANAYNSYIPSAYGFLNDCYEADVTRVTPGAGERLAQRYVKMLEQLYPTRL